MATHYPLRVSRHPLSHTTYAAWGAWAVCAARRSALVLTLLAPGLVAPSEGLGQEPPAVAVLRFENHTGQARYDNLGRGLAAMMISDLSVLDEIRLVERERIEELQAELAFQQSAHADPATAQTTGLMVGAAFVVTGAIGSIADAVLLDTRIADVETAEIVKAADVAGPSDHLLELQQELAEVFIDGLGLVLTDDDRARLRERQEANQIGDIETALSLSRALCYLDGGAYERAAEELIDVQKAAPGSYVVGTLLGLVRSKAEDDARQRLKDQARSRIGGLFGRDRPPPRRDIRLPGC